MMDGGSFSFLFVLFLRSICAKAMTIDMYGH